MCVCVCTRYTCLLLAISKYRVGPFLNHTWMHVVVFLTTRGNWNKLKSDNCVYHTYIVLYLFSNLVFLVEPVVCVSLYIE